MNLRPLPPEVVNLLSTHAAPPRLVAHLELVHDVAAELTEKLALRLPELKFDRKAVLMGAATHDIGKAICTRELSEHGSQHEELGHQILVAAGFPPAHARFALTHGGAQREPNPTIEDLLVRTADAIWKGGRYHDSEMELVRAIAEKLALPEWNAYSVLDEILSELASSASERLLYHADHPTE